MAGDIWKLGVSWTPTSRFTLAVMVWIVADILSRSQVEGHYCQPGWCKNYQEYCCGIDLCCDYLTGYWYIWMVTGILVFSVILICCWSWSSNFFLAPKQIIDTRDYVPVVETGPQGEEYHIHQQPPIRSVVYGTSGAVYIAKEYRGQIVPVTSRAPTSESQQSSHYPPPAYSSTEHRATPSAPPAGK